MDFRFLVAPRGTRFRRLLDLTLASTFVYTVEWGAGRVVPVLFFFN
jgi:hypothetical protein